MNDSWWQIPSGRRCYEDYYKYHCVPHEIFLAMGWSHPIWICFLLSTYLAFAKWWRNLNMSKLARPHRDKMYTSTVLYQDTFLPPLHPQHSLCLSSMCSWVTTQKALLHWQCGCPYPASSIILWEIACIAPVWTKEQWCVALCFCGWHWLVLF